MPLVPVCELASGLLGARTVKVHDECGIDAVGLQLRLEGRYPSGTVGYRLNGVCEVPVRREGDEARQVREPIACECQTLSRSLRYCCENKRGN